MSYILTFFIWQSFQNGHIFVVLNTLGTASDGPGYVCKVSKESTEGFMRISLERFVDTKTEDDGEK